MTVPSTARRAGPFNGTGSLVSYPFTFKIFSKYDLAITVADAAGVETPLTIDSTALVTLNVDQDASPGGSVQYAVGGVAAALPAGYTLGILSDAAFEQAVDLPDGGAYRAGSVEGGMDALAIQVQQLAERMDRTVGLSMLAGDGVSSRLPVPSPLKHLGWNSAGNAIVNLDAGESGGSGGGSADLVSYDPLATYAANTAGAELIVAQAQTRHLWAKLRTNQSDVRIMVVGDSTGNEVTEWVYLMAQWLATKCPTHTVKYRLFSDGAMAGSNAWGAYATLQTGSGATLPDTGQNTIWIDNASVGGINTFYYQGARESIVWDGSDYDLVISNFGHNLGTAMTEDIALPEWVIHLSHVRLMAPRAGLLVTLQNPRSSVTSDINTNGSAQSARMITAWRKAADMVGAGVIDVYTAFKTAADYPSLMADETHPSAAGSAVWLAEVKRVMAEPVRLTGDTPRMFNPLADQRPNYAPNPRFARWTGSTPDGWSFTNCTPSKTTGFTDGTLYGVKVLIGAGADPKITADVTSFLGRFKGKTVTMAVRLWRPAGLDLLAGRISIESTDNITNPSFTSYPRGTPSQDGWEWAIATLTVPRTATALSLRIYAGAAAGTDSGKSFYIDSVWLGEGLLPATAAMEDVPLKFVTDYYNDANVGRITGNTGTLTVSNGTATLTGSPSTASDVYINLPGLTTGQQYTFSFTAGTVTGNTGGGIYVRNGFNGGSTTITTGTWNASTAGSVTFTAPSAPVSIWFYGYTGTTGYVVNNLSIKPVASGIAAPLTLPLLLSRNDSGTLAGTASSGLFGIVYAAGSSMYLQAGGVVGGTTTAYSNHEVAVPSDYIAGRNLTLTINALADGAGTLGATKLIDAFAYRVSTSGAFGSDVVTTSAQTLTKTAADYAFSIDGGTLAPGDKMQIRVSMAVQESGGSSTLSQRINSIRLQ